MPGWMLEQDRYLKNLPLARHATLIVSFDETEMIFHVDKEVADYSFLMVHYVLVWVLDDGSTQQLELPCPPCIIADTTAATLVTALLRRMPMDLAAMKCKCGTLSLVLCSDSARACLRAARPFRWMPQQVFWMESLCSTRSASYIRWRSLVA